MAVQYFHVMDVASGDVTIMRSTTKAWTDDEREAMLREAGFTDIAHHDDWPRANDHFTLTTTRK